MCLIILASITLPQHSPPLCASRNIYLACVQRQCICMHTCMFHYLCEVILAKSTAPVGVEPHTGKWRPHMFRKRVLTQLLRRDKTLLAAKLAQHGKPDSDTMFKHYLSGPQDEDVGFIGFDDEPQMAMTDPTSMVRWRVPSSRVLGAEMLEGLEHTASYQKHFNAEVQQAQAEAVSTKEIFRQVCR